jgi:hypothetical protein
MSYYEIYDPTGRYVTTFEFMSIARLYCIHHGLDPDTIQIVRDGERRLNRE